MKKKILSIIAAFAMLSAGLLPALGFCIETGAAGVAVESSGSALSVMSMAAVPMMIMQNILPDNFQDGSAPGSKKDDQPVSRHGGLGFAPPESRSSKIDRPEKSIPVFMPGLALCGSVIQNACSVVVLPLWLRFLWLSCAALTLLLSRRGRARGDTGGYILFVESLLNAVRAFPVRVFYLNGGR